ncbi:hypothetical protein [Chryseobacterium sp.]|uniref:hypothetical protein n=1 Tax=Chryseobacterium sp. TaxID=1871047 RepID=UPI0028975BDD|nr:hypothetical protein [Chryseobacterium sp.]
MEKKYESRQYRILVWAVTLSVFFIGLIACITTDSIYSLFSNTTKQTYTLIFVLSALVFIIIGINLYYSKIISIVVKEDSLIIKNTETNTQSVIQKNTVINYNLNTTYKGMHDILRIKLNDQNIYLWLGGISFNQENNDDRNSKENLLENRKIELPKKNVKTSTDRTILFFANKFPFIMLFIALAAFIFGFVYLLNI